MPRFAFHVIDQKQEVDTQETTLPDIAAARREAVRYAGLLLADKSDDFQDAHRWLMDVTDGDGRSLFRFAFFSMIEEGEDVLPDERGQNVAP